MFDGGRPRPAIEAAVSRHAIPPRLLPFPKQHDKHVQHADGHEQNDENPQNRPERLAERDQDEADDHVILGSGSSRWRDLLAAYLDRRHPRWREDAQGDAATGSGPARSRKMTKEEAYQIG